MGGAPTRVGLVDVVDSVEDERGADESCEAERRDLGAGDGDELGEKSERQEGGAQQNCEASGASADTRLREAK